ncbi:maleylpyruvate isomerase N-terminal domain-containing protein [Streptomyces sp. NPDC048751]|uniref:maleylpyruvate isomerase N-terminal domain-containing protein n=1 Tax=Streptomyces sp. NPDC048751 TaxID=3365591 RepID=UPI00371B4DB7
MLALIDTAARRRADKQPCAPDDLGIRDQRYARRPLDGSASYHAQWTVSGLAGHLAYQIFSVDPALEGPASEQEPVPVLEHYARAVWIDAPLDGEISSGIRAKGENISSEGLRRLVERVHATLDRQRTGLEEVHGDWVVFMPQTGWALSLDDFLVTRIVELAVHMDDLAVSVGLSTPELPGAALDPVVALLTGLAVRRHGQAALLRALTRAERAPAEINVF